MWDFPFFKVLTKMSSFQSFYSKAFITIAYKLGPITFDHVFLVIYHFLSVLVETHDRPMSLHPSMLFSKTAHQILMLVFLTFGVSSFIGLSVIRSQKFQIYGTNLGLCKGGGF